MTNPWFTDPEALKSSQYASEKNLSARIRIHSQFSTNPLDYPQWIFDHMLNDFGENANIAEMGCGNGLIWKENLNRIPEGWTITLTDLSQGMLFDARRNLGDHANRFNFQVVDVQDMPFETNQFDNIIANFMLYHVPNRQRAIGEIRRALKDNGMLHTVTLGINHMIQFHQAIEPIIPRYTWTHEKLVFNAENAIEQLNTYFSSIETILYDSDLRVTEAQPLVDYLASTARVENITPDELASFRDQVQSVIDMHGEFFIQKDMVLFKSQGYAG